MRLTEVLLPPPAVVKTTDVVTLSTIERADLIRLTTAGRSAARTIRHAQVLLRSDASPAGPRWIDEQIRKAFGIGSTAIVRLLPGVTDQAGCPSDADSALHASPEGGTVGGASEHPGQTYDRARGTSGKRPLIAWSVRPRA